MVASQDRVVKLYHDAHPMHMTHFYTLGKAWSTCAYANPPLGWSGCIAYAMGGYSYDGDFVTGVVWFNPETERFSEIQPIA